MAETRTISDTPVKTRHPLAPTGLIFLTFGIYGIVWYYKVNKEVHGVAGTGDPVKSLLAVTLGALTIVLPIVSWFRTAERVSQLQQREGVSSPVSPALAVVLLFVPLGVAFTTYYIQSALNQTWERMGQGMEAIAEVSSEIPVPIVPPAVA